MLELTTQERLIIWRRRLNCHQIVIEKMHPNWGKWERGEIPIPLSILISIPNMDLTKGEECHILRRRKGITIKDAASHIGISHITLIRMERDEVVSEEPYLRYLNYLEEGPGNEI